MHDDASTTAPAKKKRKYPSSSERKRRRIALGLPPVSEARLAAEKRRMAKRARTKDRAHYAMKRAFIDGVKMESGCVECGYKGHPAALHFDHLPGTIKRVDVSRMTGTWSMAAVTDEMAKCEVVCANCHAIRTAERRIARQAE